MVLTTEKTLEKTSCSQISRKQLTKEDKSPGAYFVKIYPKGKGISIQEKIIIQ